MKKICSLLFATALTLILSVSAFAEDANQSHVWIERAETEGFEATITTDGEITDGVLVLNYDAEKLSITEESAVEASEAILYYSVNVSEAGTVKISFIADEAKAEELGTLFVMDFDAEAGEDAANLVTFDESTAYANTADGSSAVLGKKEVTEEPSTEEGSTEEESTGEESTEEESVEAPSVEESTSVQEETTTAPINGDGTNTGDTSPIMVLMILAVVSAAVMFASKFVNMKNVK